MAIYLMPSPEQTQTPSRPLHKRDAATTYGIRRISDGAWWSSLLERWVDDREIATRYPFYTVAALLGSVTLDCSATLWEVTTLTGAGA